MYNSEISLNNLCKSFQGVAAVDLVILMIDKRKIFGLLRSNDAGKSIIIEMLTTILRPSCGSATTIGGKLTGRENLDFRSRLSNIDRDVYRKRIDKVLDIVDMREMEAFDDPISKLQQRKRRS
jgi:ABC-2 type transport system ATP-binding protein